jgi:hypothetical protein
MDQVSGSPKIYTLSRAGHQRIKNRLFREIRYRYLYPWIGSLIFPMPPPSGNGLNRLPGWEGFNEGLAKRVGFRKQILEQAEDLCQDCFSFLNLPMEGLGEAINWDFAPAGDPLWQYELHYGEWALVLSHAFLITQELRFRDVLIRLLTDWIANNPVGQGPGWEPYPISRRLVFWSRVGNAFKEDLKWKIFWRDILGNSLRQQGQVLAANLEKDLGNNHLIANYRALAWMGLLFPDWPEASAWRGIGLEGLWVEMRDQVLPDGVHDERSISYHTLVLQDLLEVWRLCLATKEPVPEDVAPTLGHMLQFLAYMQAPDGSYPMLNDTVPNYPLDPRSVLLAGGLLLNRPEWVLRAEEGDASYAAWLVGKDSFGPRGGGARKELPAAVAYPYAGYVVLRSGSDDQLYFDSGAMGPSHLPGHGHADALNFLLFAEGRWLIVDPGVFSYHDRQWRDHFRSTRAHNTVTIDGQDQCVFWGPFRVAYPPETRLLEWSEAGAIGEHEGYRRLNNPLVHRRSIEKKRKGEWEIWDHFSGRGKHEFVWSLQFAPEAQGEINGLNGEIRWPEGIALKVICPSSLPNAEARLEPGWVSFGWNLKQEAPRYVLRWKGQAPLESRMIIEVTKR